MCVCVCVCVCGRTGVECRSLQNDVGQLRDAAGDERTALDDQLRAEFLHVPKPIPIHSQRFVLSLCDTEKERACTPEMYLA
jgi:hypothetical protein